MATRARPRLRRRRARGGLGTPDGTSGHRAARDGQRRSEDDIHERLGLAITLPLTPETRGLLGDRELRRVKPTAFLVNVARAEIVDEDALYDALAEQRLAGAALDVWYRYPSAPGPALPARRPFHELPNVLMTPHLSGWTDEMLDARAKLIAENIARTARGEPPLNLIR